MASGGAPNHLMPHQWVAIVRPLALVPRDCPGSSAVGGLDFQISGPGRRVYPWAGGGDVGHGRVPRTRPPHGRRRPRRLAPPPRPQASRGVREWRRREQRVSSLAVERIRKNLERAGSSLPARKRPPSERARSDAGGAPRTRPRPRALVSIQSSRRCIGNSHVPVTRLAGIAPR